MPKQTPAPESGIERGGKRKAATKPTPRPRLKRPPKCVDCDRYYADLPSRLCQGCEAYREHTGYA